MLEIALFGVVLVAIYLIAHTATQQVERWCGHPLGGWRSVVFFCVFLSLLLVAMWWGPQLLGAVTGGSA